MRRFDPVLLGIVLLGLALRLVGLRWGLPSAEHVHSYHPDEILLVGAAAAANPFLGDLTTGFYNYGSFIPLLLRVLYDVTSLFLPPPTADWMALAQIHLLGRLLSVFFGTLTILLAYDLGRRLVRLAGGAPPPAEGAPPRPERLAGLCAAGLLALAPLHVAHSHYLTVDVTAAFWATATLCAALRLLEAPRLRMALLAGLCAGLAAGTKYNAGIAVAAPLAALALSTCCRRTTAGARERQPAAGAGGWRRWLRRPSKTASGGEGAPAPSARAGEGPVCDAPPGVTSRAWRALLALVCLGAAAVAFLAACPGVLLESDTFLSHFFYELKHVRTEHGLVFQGTPPAWIYHFTTSLRFGLGLPLLAVLLAGLVQAARRRSAADLVLLAWVLPYYVLIGGAQVKFQRYTIPLAPALLVWSGVLCADWLARAACSRARALAAAAIVGVGFWTAGGGFAYALLFASKDPRDRAAEWSSATRPPGASVALTTEPWFYTPPLVPWNGGLKTRHEFERARSRWPYAFLPGGWTAQRLLAERPQCFIASNLEEQIRDGIRLGLPEARNLVMMLERLYRKEVFAPSVAWPGLLGPGNPPEDWIYPAPTITVYLRREP
ncbi:MAG: phospholipid carrier-dependent glycosyltransferase [Armatimonadetes bacterium]|nr:phospholipid carrier-dependent glycosyltransferase [Armatimonadota bacterium]